jgi:monoamine oxidase
MARTPLMQAVLRSLRTVREAAAAGVPAEEWAGMRREALTRRQAMRAAAGAAGAALLAGCAVARDAGDAPAPRAGGPRVVVVGAGVAGLHCAWRLRRLGIAAEVFEGSGRTGGRILTNRITFRPQACELGGELVDTGHATMLDLATEFGLELLDFTTDEPSLARWTAFIGGRRVPEKEVLEGFAPVAEKVGLALAALRDRAAAIGYRDRNGAEALDAVSIRRWLDGAGCEGPVRRLLDAAYTTEYGLETDDSSALNFLRLVSTDLAKFEVFGDSDERYRFRAGNEVVVERLAAAVGPARVLLGARLVKVSRAPDGRLVLAFDRGLLGTVEVAADQAVLAIPFTLLRDVELDLDLPPVKRRAIAELGYGTNAKLMVGFRERVWRGQGSNGEVFTDLPFQCTWETSRLQPGAEGILTNFTGGSRGIALGAGTAELRAQELVDDLDRVFPGAGDAYDRRVSRMHWPTFPWTRGSYASYRVGQATAFGGAEIEPVGNLHFCGEHTSADAQGYMEGGALTGAMAALEVAGALGVEAGKTAGAGGPEGRILDRARTAMRYGRWLPVAAAAARRRRPAGVGDLR